MHARLQPMPVMLHSSMGDCTACTVQPHLRAVLLCRVPDAPAPVPAAAQEQDAEQPREGGEMKVDEPQN
jgi:hypothetical protein